MAAILALYGSCLPLAAQEPGRTDGPNVPASLSLYQADNVGRVDGLALLRSLALRNLMEGRYYFSGVSPFDQMGTGRLDAFPYSRTVDVQRYNGSLRYQSGPPVRVGDLSPNYGYVGGEVGVLYGRASGKYGGDDFQSYITGTAGNEHFQITAGASYEESTMRFPRGRR